MADFTEIELKQRIDKLQDFLVEKGIPVAVLNQNSDVYYYTGSLQPLYVLIPAKGTPVALARKAVNRMQEEVRHIAAEAFFSTKDLTGIIQKYQMIGVNRIGLTLDTTSYATVQRWQQIFQVTETVDLSLDIRFLRMVKSQTEIGILAKAGQVMAKIPEILNKYFKPGITELELSAALENYFRLNGHEVLVRCRREGIEMNMGVCSSGINTLAGTKFDGICAGVGISAAVPYGASHELIPKNTPVVLDYAFNYKGYHLDQTRMFCWGEPSQQVMAAYQAMLQVERQIIEELKPGVLWQTIYQNALKLAGELGYEAEFMGLGAEKVRFVGHGVGLELDEPPFLAPKMEFPLQMGMVVAIEPKVALPEVGVVGIEDTLVIGETSCEMLTKCSQDFIVVE